MPPFFFQKFWGIVGSDVTRAITTIFQSRKLLKQINYTHVSLIPKVKTLKDLSHFRPLSLCNVIFKIASMVVANRLKHILTQIISPTQIAFVPGCHISDNTFLVAEIAI
ncbi:hypothetical protein ACFX2G_040692 [Malus domestica]